jgi:hypothetical protein
VKINLFFLAAIWALSGIFVFGCIVVNGDGFSVERKYGSGTVIFEERDVPVFDQIHLKGTGKVILTLAARQNVRVETDDNLMPYIRTEVENGKLVISHERKNMRPTVLKIYTSATSLAGVSISGSGDINASDEFISEDFYADIAGSGDMSLKVRANSLESSISGSGSIYLVGSADSYDATITGSGDVDAFEMQARESTVVITGSGNCRVSVSDLLKTKITGSGDVLYKGHPEISKSITGSGKVKDRN